jgi:putative ABC transport system permease protein
MFMDESAQKRFGAFGVGEYREVLGRRLQIIGKTRGAKSFTTTPISFVDYRLAQELQSQLRGNTTYILVKLAPGADPDAVKAEIARRLPHNDVYTKAEWAARSRGYWVTSTGIGFSMYLTVFLGCLVGLIVVAQTLYTSTMEHLKEFGTVKAIGGSNGDIYRILARQAGISAIVGFVLGAIPSLGVRTLAGRIGLDMLITPQFMGVVLVGTVALCLLSSMISFRKVASIDPSLVFRA